MILDVEGEHFISRSGDVQLSWELDDLSSHAITKIVDNLTGEIIDLSSSIISDEYTFQVESIGDFPFQSNTVNGTYPFLGNPRFQIVFAQGVVESDQEKNVPDFFTIDRVYPNPFNPSVIIDYHVSNDSEVDFSVYDLKGVFVDRLFKGKIVSGYHQIEWVPKNISSGIYLIKLRVNSQIINKKLTYLK